MAATATNNNNPRAFDFANVAQPTDVHENAFALHVNGASRSSPTPNLEELELVQRATHHNCAELYLRKMFANGECVQLQKDRRDAEAVFMRINEDRNAAEVALARINNDCRVAETAFSRVDDDWRAAEDRLRELEVAYIEAEAEFEAAAKRYAAAKRQAEAEAERLAAERLAAERLAAERIEAERLEAERVEAERVAAATRIQALARSFVLRRRFVAIVAANQTLQRAFRCRQARRQLVQLRTEAAAAKLQRAFRCYLARVRVAQLRAGRLAAVEQQAAAMDVDDLGGGGCDDADQREADQLEAERANAERLADQQRDVDLVAIAQLAADTETKRARGVRSFPPAEVVYANLQSLRKEATQLREAAEVAYEAGREALYDRFPAFAPNSADSQLRNSANVSDAMASVPRDRKRKADKEAKKAAKKEAQLLNQRAHMERKQREEERKLEELRRERDRLQALVAAKAVNPRDNKNSMGTEPDPENDILPAGARRLKAPTSFKPDCTSLADDTPQPQPRQRQRQRRTLKATSSSAPAPAPAPAPAAASSSSSVYMPCFKLTLDEKSRIARDLALLTPEFLAKLYQIIRDFPMLFSGGQNQPTPSGICLSQDQDEKDICVCLPDDVQKTTIPGIMFIFTAYLTGDQCDDPASIQAFFAAVEYHVDRILN